MVVIYSDEDIRTLTEECKPLPSDWRERTQPKPRPGHYERELNVTGCDGSKFRLILRKSKINQYDFSIILGVLVPGTNRVFRLRRCNGSNHQHTNTIERVTFRGFHIHFATERYQATGAKEDAYAEPVNGYGDFYGALNRMIADANFDASSDSQGRLFEEW